jgi:hypothetical protein
MPDTEWVCRPAVQFLARPRLARSFYLRIKPIGEQGLKWSGALETPHVFFSSISFFKDFRARCF